MTQMVKFSEKRFKITVLNIPKPLMEEVDSMQDQLGNFSGEAETLKESTTNAEIKNTIKWKMSLTRFIIRPDTAKEGISEHQDKLKIGQ